jgi:hypothetical protein
MKKKQKLQYTIRDVPKAADLRLREVAASEDLSLNEAAVRALERGLGLQGEPVIYRRLRHLVSPPSEIDRKAWEQSLAAMDQVDEEAWK